MNSNKLDKSTNQNITTTITMKFSTAKATEQSAYEQIRQKPLTKIHGRPTRLDRNQLRDELCAAASEVDMPFEENGEYGLLGEVMEADEYTNLTGLVHMAVQRPTAYDEDIDEDTLDYLRKQMEALHNERLEGWYTRVGALRAMGDNIRDALDEKYYLSLKQPIIAYKKVAVRAYLKLLDDKWCKLDTRVIKKMKEHYLRGWELDNDEHIEEFIKRLNEEQESLIRDSILFSNEDKLQHFLEQMYECGVFERRDYKEWEDKPDNQKTWAAATKHFADIVDNMDTYNHNIGGTAKKSRFESTAQVEQAAAATEEMEAQERNDDAALQQFMEQSAKKDEHIQAVTANQTSLVSMQSEMQKMILGMQQQMREQTEQMAVLKQQLKQQPKQVSDDRSGGTGGGSY